MADPASEPRVAAIAPFAVPEHQAASDAAPSAAERGPGRPSGGKKVAGRKKGSKNRRTVAGEVALKPLVPGAKKRIRELIQSDDEKVALAAVQSVLAYVYGKPVEKRELSGPEGGPVQAEDLTTTEELSTTEAVPHHLAPRCHKRGYCHRRHRRRFRPEWLDHYKCCRCRMGRNHRPVGKREWGKSVFASLQPEFAPAPLQPQDDIALRASQKVQNAVDIPSRKL